MLEKEKVELAEKIYYCYVPMDEKQRMHCTDSSDKNKVGLYLEFPSGYYEYFVNESGRDIQKVVYKHHLIGDQVLGALPAGKSLYCGAIEGWAFDLPAILHWKLYLNPLIDPIEISFRESSAQLSKTEFIPAIGKAGCKNKVTFIS